MSVGSPPARIDTLPRVIRWLRIGRAMSRDQWQAATRVAIWVCGTRVALAVLPWRWVSGAFDKTPVRETSPDQKKVRTLLWALRAVPRRLLPERPCLTQALVGRRLLRQLGLNPELQIGVTIESGRLQAHAWLEQDGVPVVGGADSPRKYARLEPTRPPAE